ncbi:MAG: hypothetical protein WKF77_23370, partial [Planctomycetaceae bacterium]
MTSSFTTPGGNKKLYRAEAVTIMGNPNAQSVKIASRTKVLTRWVPLPETTGSEFVTARPPGRDADYVGQIIAVAVAEAPSAAQS